MTMLNKILSDSMHGLTETPQNGEKISLIEKRLKEKNFNITMCKEIGRGSYGSIFQINDKTVMKISRDSSESRTCSILKKHPHPFVVNIYDVFKCKFGSRMYYFIVMEKLNKPTKTWSNFMDNIPGEVCDLSALALDKLLKNPRHSKTTIRHKIRYSWLQEIAKHFDSLKIKFADFHGGNIMRRDKNHILIDIGVASAPRQKIEQILC